jgi:hypothetical protein
LAWWDKVVGQLFCNTKQEPTACFRDEVTYNVNGSVKAPEAGVEEVGGISKLDHIDIRRGEVAAVGDENHTCVVGVHVVRLVADRGRSVKDIGRLNVGWLHAGKGHVVICHDGIVGSPVCSSALAGCSKAFILPEDQPV